MASAAPRLHQSFVTMERYRYAIVPILLAGACIAAYLVQPHGRRSNGGTPLGLTLGTIAAGLIVVLMGYGIRRRIFRAKIGNATRWLSIHVYLGLTTIIVASLHCGFQFGANIHTVTYALMCLVVASGCWGVYAYLRYPALLTRVRGNASRDQLMLQVTEFDQQALNLAVSLNPGLRELIIDAIRRTRIGGGLWTQLRGSDESTLLLGPPLHAGLASVVANEGQCVLIDVLSRQQAAGADPRSREALDQLLKITGNKAVVQRKLQRDLQFQGLMQFWLYLHLPLSFGLLVALPVHVFAVFFYR